MECKTSPNRKHVQLYKGRLIKADPNDPTPWTSTVLGQRDLLFSTSAYLATPRAF